MKKIYAIFGGSFNPIHYGHLYSAKNLSQEINLNKIILLPNKNPPHKKNTKISIVDKINMIKLGINNHHLFDINYLETKTKNIFYTIDTLKIIRKKIGDFTSLCLIIGEDHLQNFHLWKRWQEILFFTHLLICPRKNIKKKTFFLKEWIDLHTTDNYHLLHEQPFGLIFFSKIPLINISSTQIRKNYYEGKSSFGLLPSTVDNYINRKKLYNKIL